MSPTLEHNGFVEMFRENPALAPHFLDILFHIDVPPHTSVAVVESALDQLMPIEFRADLVLELKDANGENVLAIILEVQRDKDPDKKFSWAAYVAVVYARKRCPTIVLVVAPDDDVATWAAEPIDMGLGRGIVAPLVLGPKVVPEVTEEAQAEQEKELAVLSAVAHGNGPNGPAVLMAAIAGLERLDKEHAAAYFQIVYNVLREPMRRALEKLIMQRQTEAKAPLPPFIQQFVEGGKQEGKLEAKRETLLRLLGRAAITLSDDDKARISSCTDAAALDRWLDNVIGAKTAADVFS